jgi:GNAT superfamily N-acetyltransferase
VPQSNRRVLYSLFNNIRGGAEAVFEHPAYAAFAVYNPGKPVWIWFNDGMSEAGIRHFFCAFLREYPAPHIGLITTGNAAAICAEKIKRPYTTRGITAYYAATVKNFSAAGHLRPAVLSDMGLVNDWLGKFYAEALEASPPLPVKPQAEGNNAGAGSLFIWQHGAPCAMGMLCEPSVGFCRFNLIYTTHEMRRRGYGRALVSALAQMALKRDALPFLFTGSRNIITNRLYASLGFCAAGGLTEVVFDEG